MVVLVTGLSLPNILSKLMRGALTLLIIAIVLTLTIELLQCIWPWLVGIAVVAGVIYLLVRLVRNWRGGW